MDQVVAVRDQLDWRRREDLERSKATTVRMKTFYTGSCYRFSRLEKVLLGFIRQKFRDFSQARVEHC